MFATLTITPTVGAATQVACARRGYRDRARSRDDLVSGRQDLAKIGARVTPLALAERRMR